MQHVSLNMKKSDFFFVLNCKHAIILPIQFDSTDFTAVNLSIFICKCCMYCKNVNVLFSTENICWEYIKDYLEPPVVLSFFISVSKLGGCSFLISVNSCIVFLQRGCKYSIFPSFLRMCHCSSRWISDSSHQQAVFQMLRAALVQVLLLVVAFLYSHSPLTPGTLSSSWPCWLPFQWLILE